MTDAALRSCPHCGARVSLPAGQLSQPCAFCDTPLVAWDGAREPVDLVAPFALDKRQAAERLRRELKGRFWAPEAVRRLDPEDLVGVLVPFYCYDATTRSEYRARVGIWWYKTVTYTTTVNGRTQVRTRTERHTEWFPIEGSHAAAYRDHLVCGSRGIPEGEANALEPFDLGLARPFDPGLLSGWAAELPDVGHEEARRTADQELARRENEAIRAFLPGDEKDDVHNETRTEVGAVRLVLLPVWSAAYRWKGQALRLLVNGQTGEVVGELPRSWVKIGLAVALGLFLLGSALLCGGLLAAIAGQLA